MHLVILAVVSVLFQSSVSTCLDSGQPYLTHRRHSWLAGGVSRRMIGFTISQEKVMTPYSIPISTYLDGVLHHVMHFFCVTILVGDLG